MRGEKQDKIPCRFPVIWDWSVFDLVCLIPLRFTTPPFKFKRRAFVASFFVSGGNTGFAGG